MYLKNVYLCVLSVGLSIRQPVAIGTPLMESCRFSAPSNALVCGSKMIIDFACLSSFYSNACKRSGFFGLIDCAHCHARTNKIKNHSVSVDKFKKL